ncbi:universal stress protein [Trinickia violacea]|uniref:Universal stress protein n=1 Tax=Trinickia violacea TaxID=2571746 RepID=A0A4P8J6Y2_9BURK|nr:universal stress protein [Trinickia violacea]
MLLVYDGTDEAKSALLRCAELSVALAARVDVVTVVNFADDNAMCGGMLSSAAMTQLEDQARSALREAIDALGVNGVVARGHVVFGGVLEAITRMVDLLQSDVIVVGHRTRSWLERWYHGRALHVDLVERVKGSMIVTVTPA